MSDLKEVREWIERTRELLNAGKLADQARQAEGLREGLQSLKDNPKVRQALAPELATALDELGDVLGSELDLGAELSSDEQGMQRLYRDFRSSWVQQRRSLEGVLTATESATLDLALELADSHAKARLFETATRLLQQSGHRAKAIQSEGREGGLVDVVAEDAAALKRRREEAQLAINKASERVATLVGSLQPMSGPEKALCLVFTAGLREKLLADAFEDALALLQQWFQMLTETAAADKDGEARRQRAREQLKAREQARGKLDELGVKAAAEAITKAAAAHQRRLVEISRQISSFNGGVPHALEPEIGRRAFEVERQCKRLADADLPSDRAKDTAASWLVQAEAALQALQTLKDDAEKTLKQAQVAFQQRLADQKLALAKYLKAQDAVVDKQALAVAKQQEALDRHDAQAKQMSDGDGKKLQNPFSKTSIEFYQGKIDTLEPRENKKPALSKDEKALLTTARMVIKAKAARDEAANDLASAQQRLADLEQQREDDRKPLDAAVESAKRPQVIWWEPPAPVRYGTALDGTQLNATTSADNGRIRYLHNGQEIVPGETRLPAGKAQVLRAEVVDGDRDTFQAAVPKDVTIDVDKASVTLSCTDRITLNHGAAFTRALLGAGVTTTPLWDSGHAGPLASIVVKADGQTVKDPSVLDAKAWSLVVTCPEGPNHLASNEVTVAFDVLPAQQAITWDGAAPTTMTYGTPLTDKQLNASVKVTSDPTLAERWDELTKALEYVDDSGTIVKVGSLLAAGDARKVTARTPDRANFAAAAVKHVVFKVEKALRTLSTGAPPKIGAIVQTNDLKQLAKVFRFTAGKGVVEYRVDGQLLAQGSKLTAGKKRKLRVSAAVDDNYQPTPEQALDIEVQGFTERFDAAKQSRTTLLTKTVHSKQKAAVDDLKQQIEGLGAVTDEQRFEKVNALLEEIEEIEARLVSWQGPVPAASPKGDADLLKVVIVDDPNDTPPDKELKRINKTVETAVKLVKHGGLTLADVEKLVPKGTANTYSPSAKYPIGFKYIWTTPSGVVMEVYGHRATQANNVPNTADSKKGNLVRVKVNGQYLKPDGTLEADKTEATSHMALY